MKIAFQSLYKWLIPAIFLAIFACKKNDDRVPTVAVNEYINLNLPEFLPLNAVNNWIYYNYAGNKGLIIMRISPSEFMAYERTCTYDPYVAASIIEGFENDIFCIDSVCNSRFSLLDGSVVSGPATQAMARYRTELVGNNILHIYN